LIFDSGVGGVTVAREIWSLLPGSETVYFCDNSFFPYGLKEEGELIARVTDVLSTVAERVQPDIVVVACNTASTVALPSLRERILVPVVGVVPAIKPAAALSKTRTIGLLGTPGTVRRAYTQDHIDRFASDCTILRVGSADLVLLAEEKFAGRDLDPGRLAATISPLLATGSSPGVDVVVLACTHFPLLRADLAALAPATISWIDSGAAIARRVDELLGGQRGKGSPSEPLPKRIFATDPGALSRGQRDALRREGFSEPEAALP